MKKSIFILMLAIFAGIFQSFGQSCDDGPFAPAAGTPYDYSVTIPAPYNQGTGSYTWYVTDNPDILAAGSIIPNNTLIIATGSGAYNTPIVGANTITIEWTAEAIGDGGPFYLVIKFLGEHPDPVPTCSAENIRVWEIAPINKFLLAIEDMTGTNGEYCAPAVASAVVTGSGAGAIVTMSYANSFIYAQITASNYTGEWRPSFQISNLDGEQSIASAAWGTTVGTYDQPCTIAGNVATSTTMATAAYDGSEIIYVQIELANGGFHNLADLTINFAVDGVIELDSGGTLDDVISDTDCSPEVVFGKNVDQILRARPTITPGTGTFITEAP